eukprot:6404332-Prymnesium_polylepis.1
MKPHVVPRIFEGVSAAIQRPSVKGINPKYDQAARTVARNHRRLLLWRQLPTLDRPHWRQPRVEGFGLRQPLAHQHNWRTQQGWQWARGGAQFWFSHRASTSKHLAAPTRAPTRRTRPPRGA